MNHNKFYTSSIQVLFKFYWSCYKNTTSSIEFCKNGLLFIPNSTQARCSCYDWRIWPPGALKVDGQTAKSLNWNPDLEWSWMKTFILFAFPAAPIGQRRHATKPWNLYDWLCTRTYQSALSWWIMRCKSKRCIWTAKEKSYPFRGEI